MENLPAGSPRQRHFFKKLLIGLGFFILIVSLIALAWQQQQWQAHEQQQTKQVLKQQAASTYSLHQQLLQVQQQQQRQITDLQQQLQRVITQTNGNIKSWKIAEIAYLIRLADMQLHVQHAFAPALTLLLQAQSIANALNDPRLGNFQQAITHDITLLKDINGPDKLMIIDQLKDLQDQVPSLALLTAPTPAGSAVIVDSTRQQHKKWWQRAWDNIKISFKKLVIVQHELQPLPGLMPPQQQVYLEQNLQLLLIQARWALLNQQIPLYQQSLSQVKTWLIKYYVPNSATTANFLKQLQTLRALNLTPTLPDLNHLLTALPQE